VKVLLFLKNIILLCITIQSTKYIYKNCVGALKEIVAALKMGLMSYMSVFRKQYNDSSSVLQARSPVN
jgi:hypothetical protein